MFSFPASDLSLVVVTAGPAAAAAGKSVVCNANLGSNTCLVTGFNANSIQNGIVATATFTISAVTAKTSPVVQLASALGATVGGAVVPVLGGSGTAETGSGSSTPVERTMRFAARYLHAGRKRKGPGRHPDRRRGQVRARRDTLVPSQPARAGDFVSIYATGLVEAPVQVLIGGVPAEVTHAGLAPGMVGIIR